MTSRNGREKGEREVSLRQMWALLCPMEQEPFTDSEGATKVSVRFPT